MNTGDYDRIQRRQLALVDVADDAREYRAAHRAQVIAQSADFSKVDLKPDNTALLPTLNGVPLRLGIPSCTAELNPGSYVRLTFDDANPQKPSAGLFDGEESASSIKRLLIAGDTPVARQGDNLTASSGIATWAGLVEGICNGIVPGTFIPGTDFATTVATPGDLGSINQGSEKLGIS